MTTDRGGLPWPWDGTTAKDVRNWQAKPARKHTCGECVYRIVSRRGIAMCAYKLVKEDTAHVPGEADLACDVFRETE